MDNEKDHDLNCLPSNNGFAPDVARGFVKFRCFAESKNLTVYPVRIGLRLSGPLAVFLHGHNAIG